MIKYNFQESNYGKFLIATSELGIVALLFYKNKNNAISKLEKIVGKESCVLDLDLKKDFLTNDVVDMKGTEFQLKVWKALQRIPLGETRSYSEIAQYIKKPKAFRAVASAIAKNNIAIQIPCHRVVSKTGDVGQYRWGKNLKIEILENERNFIQNGNNS